MEGETRTLERLQGSKRKSNKKLVGTRSKHWIPVGDIPPHSDEWKQVTDAETFRGGRGDSEEEISKTFKYSLIVLPSKRRGLVRRADVNRASRKRKGCPCPLGC